MASLRGARLALSSRWHSSVGFAASPFHSSLRPQMGGNTQRFTRRTVGTRNLHISAIAESAVQMAESYLIASHAAGMPWLVAIPVAAIAVSCLRLPLQLHAKNVSKRRTELTPVIASWNRLVDIRKPENKLLVDRQRKRILKEIGAQDWKMFIPFLNLPVWLAMTEAVRRVCGAQGGLMSLITGRYAEEPKLEGATSVEQPTTTATTTLASPSDTVGDGIQSMSSALDMAWYSSGGELLIDLAAPAPWFLPVAMSCAMLWTFVPTNQDMRAAVFDLSGSKMGFVSTRQKWQIRFTRVVLLASVVMPTVCMHLPAGLFFYWVPSMVTSHVLAKHVVKVEDTERQKTIQPCKRREMYILRNF